MKITVNNIANLLLRRPFLYQSSQQQLRQYYLSSQLHYVSVYTTVQIFMVMRRMRRRRIKVASKWLKIEYVVACSIGISEIGTILLMSKLLWVCKSFEVWPTKKTPNSKSILENCCNIKIARKLQRTLFIMYVHTYFTTIFFWNKSDMGLQSL